MVCNRVVIIVYLHHVCLVSAVGLVVHLLTVLGAYKVVSVRHIVLILLMLQESSLFVHFAIWRETLLEMSMTRIIALIIIGNNILRIQTRHSLVLHISEWIGMELVSVWIARWVFHQGTLFVALADSFDAVFLRADDALVTIWIRLLSILMTLIFLHFRNTT